MLTTLKTSLWKQFGASIDTLEQAIVLCPEPVLERKDKFFYIAYHTLVFLEYYLTFPPQGFSARLPFTLVAEDSIPEQAIDDLLPERLYSKQELLDYLQTSREKCRKLISGLTPEQITTLRFTEDAENGGKDYSVLEILLYNMRHVQHHAAQLNMMMRQQVNDAPNWVREAKDGL